MLLDLSEIFVCPLCRPVQGLVVLVDEIRDRRVVRGHLGCPECEARFPVEDGMIRFDAAERGSGADRPPGDGDGSATAAAGGGGRVRRGAGAAGDDPTRPALFRGVSRREAALRLGALLGLPEAAGPFLLGRGLGAVAASLTDTTEDGEVLSLRGAAGDGTAHRETVRPGGGGDPGAGSAEDGEAGGRVTRVVGVDGSDLPIFSGRLGGVALLGGPAGAVDEAVRVLRTGGRVAVVDPGAGVLDTAEELGVEVAARDDRALVGVRRG